MNLSRRRLLMTSAALSCFGGMEVIASSRGRPFFARKGLPIGLQLYTLGDLLEKDFQDTLQAVAAIGYRTVELAGFANRTPREFRAALDRVGLKCTSMHVAPRASADEISLSGNLERLASDARALGAEYAITPAFLPHDEVDPPRLAGEADAAYMERMLDRMTEEDWKRNARFLNEKGKALQTLGLRLAYHNHNLELKPVGKTSGLEILLEGTDPALVDFEIDVGWVAAAGQDPMQWLLRHPHRFRIMHVKDIKASTHPNYVTQQDPAEVGRGMLDWQRLLPTAYDAGVRHFFVEQEPPFEVSPLRSVAQSYAFLKRV